VGRIGKVLLVLACIAYPLLLHAFIQKDETSNLLLLLLILPLLLVAGWISLRVLGRGWWPLVAIMFLALVYFVASGQHERIGLVAVNAISHGAPNLFLLWFFGRTLLPGKEPLIAQISRRVNGELKPEMAVYTRRVTLAWSIFFGAQVTISLLLYLFAPLAAWSLFINVLNLPLLALMFATEYFWRIRRYPHHPHTSIRKAIEVYARDIAAPKKL
jgi:uncharacterized membrane protein